MFIAFIRQSLLNFILGIIPLLATNIKNKYEHASKMLQKKKEHLISGFLNKREPFSLEHHARILDDYFRESFERSVPDKTEELIQEIIYPLWDIGLDVGHATRSIKECVSLSAKDPEVLTSVLDARFICGMSLLYSELMEQIRRKIISKRSDKIINQLVESNLKRHKHFGDSTYLFEPETYFPLFLLKLYWTLRIY